MVRYIFSLSSIFVCNTNSDQPVHKNIEFLGAINGTGGDNIAERR